MKARLAALAIACASSVGCGGSAGAAPDPQEPAPPAVKGQPLRAAQIVICPDGSSYDTIHNTCVASGSISGPPASSRSPTSRENTASASIRCSFQNGWVSLVPVDAYPSDDTFLMQALIGFAQEPAFWQSQSEYADLEPYAARRCSESPETFELPAGEYFVLVGETDTFNRRGSYGRNGHRRRIRLGSSPQEITIRRSDLNLTWSCISCPFVSFLDPATGRWLPAFVVLAYRDSSSKRGTDRVRVEHVPVHNGRITLRVAEAEREVTQLDQLVIEAGGNLLLPVRGGRSSALASIDGVGVQMAPGTQIDVQYELPGMGDGFVDIHVIAHGHYDRL